MEEINIRGGYGVEHSRASESGIMKCYPYLEERFLLCDYLEVGFVDAGTMLTVRCLRRCKIFLVTRLTGRNMSFFFK